MLGAKAARSSADCRWMQSVGTRRIGRFTWTSSLTNEPSPFLTITRWSTEILCEMMQPRTDLRYASPLRIPYPRQPCSPLRIISLTRSCVSTPCFIEKPCLSCPPAILKTYPLNSSPRSMPSTSAASRFS